MAIQWNWNEKCGEVVIEQRINGETKRFIKTLYEGNCLLIMLSEWQEDGKDKYSLYSFFADERHARTLLGLTKDDPNVWADDWNKIVEIRLNKTKSRNWKKIVNLFAQAFDNIKIELYTEKHLTND